MRNVKLTVALAAVAVLSTGVVAADDQTESTPVSAEVSQLQESNGDGLIKKLIDYLRATDRGGSP